MQNIIAQLEELLEYPAGTLTGQERLSDIPEWDSIIVLGVIALSESVGGKELSPEDFNNAQTINDVINLIEQEEA
ncbi:hypothetical protein QUW15_00205 [Desulfovibrio piger]|nr:hypothetical protein [Desulfovibrio piger]